MNRRIVLLLCAVFALTVGVATANADQNGNSANAKLCQQGGWQIRYDANENPFPSEQACVTYAAQGGSITFLGISPDVVPCPLDHRSHCFAAITGQGLKPSLNLGDNVVTVVISFISNGSIHETISRPVDANGNISFPAQLFCGDLPGLTATAHALLPSGATITSNTIYPLPC
jgi:hypothetical protein